MGLHRLRRLTAVLACLLILVQAGASASGGAAPYVGYTTDSLRLRKSPSVNAIVLANIRANEALLITGESGDFYAVTYEGLKGYVMKSFVSVPGGTPPATEAPALNAYPLLGSGSTGAAVKALQQALKELSFYQGSVDAVYGAQTAAAVAAFRSKNALPPGTGADEAVQKLLYEGKPKNAAGKAVQVMTLSPLAGVTMRPGNRGDAVCGLQRRLTELGFFTDTLSCEYGTSTVEAVKAFQKQNGLAADGVSGPQTQSLLFSTSAKAKPPEISGSPGKTPSPGSAKPAYPFAAAALEPVNLRKGASLNAARILTIPKGASVSVTGTSGDFMKVSYGKYAGFVMTVYLNIPEAYLPGKVLAPDAGARQDYRSLSSGSYGVEVRALQTALKEIGFHNGASDGIFGGLTLMAVKGFQARNGLQQTGIATAELQKFLYEGKVRDAGNRQVTVKTLPPVPGFTMETGKVGEAVRSLHEDLKLLGYYKGEVTDKYTAATASAVKAFQKDGSIRQTGKADALTQLAISTAARAKRDGVQPPAQPEELNPDTVIVIHSGTRGAAVTRLQQRLVELGYYQISPDGIYNADDIAAVRAFQKQNGLKVDGIAGLATQQALYSPLARMAPGVTPTPAPVSTPAPAVSLRIGMNGPAVQALQTRLIALKYLQGKADGIFGTLTAQAVTAFQKRNSLKADGVAGAQTQTLLYSAKALPNTTPAPATPTPAPASTLIRVGDTGAPVKTMQQRLIQLKYLNGAADGIFGPATFLALKAFQVRNNLSADGIAGPLTLTRLQSSAAIPATGILPEGPGPTPPPAGFRAPAAREVRFANWYTEVRAQARSLPDVIIYDFMSGLHWNVHLFSLGKHADGEPVTRQDTQTMNSALGADNWTPRPVWVIFSDGRVYMGSTHSHGHEVDHNPSNGLTGHICVHFPREMSEAQETGPYAVSHQQAILAGWNLTQNMIK